MSNTQYLEEFVDHVFLIVKHQSFLFVSRHDIFANFLASFAVLREVLASPHCRLHLEVRVDIALSSDSSSQLVKLKNFTFIFSCLLKVVDISIEFVSYKHVLELHHVSRQCSCLVAEDVAYLADVFHNTHCFAVDKLASVPGEHESVIVDEVGLEDFDEFEGDLQ